MAEKARRDEENLILDGIIQLFIEQVSILAGKTKASATDFSDDGSFNQSQGVDYTADNVDSYQSEVYSATSAANSYANKVWVN